MTSFTYLLDSQNTSFDARNGSIVNGRATSGNPLQWSALLTDAVGDVFTFNQTSFLGGVPIFYLSSFVMAGVGSDNILGGMGHDESFGGAGDDFITANRNSDILVGGSGFDTLVLDENLIWYDSGSPWTAQSEIDRNIEVDLRNNTFTLSYEKLVGQVVNPVTGEVQNTYELRTEISTLSGFEAVIGTEQEEYYKANGVGTISAGGGRDFLELSPYSGRLTPSNDTVDMELGTSTRFNSLRFVTETLNFSGIEILLTGIGNDVVFGTSGGETIIAGDGNDEVHGRDGSDFISGADGADRLYGDEGVDFLHGHDGNDFLYGGDGDDLLEGGTGADRFFGGAGPDTVSYENESRGITMALDNATAAAGGALGDVFSGIENAYGSDYRDTITGSRFANELRGGRGADVLSGGAGNDILLGQEGPDTMTGGSGNDVFAYLPNNASTVFRENDTITDFTSGDRLQFRNETTLSGGIFFTVDGLPSGPLAATLFQSRANDRFAQDSNDRFVYRRSDHTLWFDPDGGDGTSAGAINAQLIATFSNGYLVTAEDIFVV